MFLNDTQLTYNVPQLGEVRDFQHQSLLELLNLKFSTICQTKQQTPHLAKLLLSAALLSE